MATYVPNASELTEPTGDKQVSTAAPEFRALKVLVDRAVKWPVGESTTFQDVLPIAGQRAGRFLAFDSVTGRPITGPLISEWTITQAQIANITTVAGNIANVNIVAANIVNVNINVANMTSINTNAANIVAIQNASANATAAANSAAAALASQNSASTSATTATTKASEAVASASAAAGSATSAGTSATNAAASAAAAAVSASSVNLTTTSVSTLTNKTLTNPVINGFTGDTSAINIGPAQIVKLANGDVGIGTASPQVKLAVNGGTLSVQGTVENLGLLKLGDNTQSISYVGVYRSAPAQIATGGNFLNLSGYDGIAFTSGPLQSSLQSERMRITADGKVGVGTTTPRAQLDVSTNGSGLLESSFHIGYSASDFYGNRIVNLADPSLTASGLFKIQRGTTVSWVDTLIMDEAGNFGIGIVPTQKVHVNGNVLVPLGNSFCTFTTDYGMGTPDQSGLQIFSGDAMRFGKRTAGVFTERMRIDSASGGLMVGATSSNFGSIITARSTSSYTLESQRTGTGSEGHISFVNGNGAVGSIFTSGATTAYNTSSDYRLKDITGPVTDSGAFIDALKPKQGTWKADGSKFVGFLAHEFAEVSPGSVTGEKDAVDENGKPVMQAMQASSAEVIANLVAELQALRLRVAALEAA